MIEARNIKLEDDILSLEYKSDLDNNYEFLVYDVKNDVITKSSVIDISDYRERILYLHLIFPILKLEEAGELEDTYFNVWY